MSNDNNQNESIAIIITHYVCPTLGCFMANLMFAAPIRDLRYALLSGNLESLNPFPWSMMTGNCLGWVAYGYYRHDPFMIASNLPGLMLSLWLNTGASKIQYLQLYNHHKSSSSSINSNTKSSGSSNLLIFVSQEINLLTVLSFWCVALVYIGWIYKDDRDDTFYNNNNDKPARADLVGYIVNCNLIFFYASPLQTIKRVIVFEKNSDSIHVPTTIMTIANTAFWIVYGIAIMDMVVIVPNAIGLFLGFVQGLLCVWYPKTVTPTTKTTPYASLSSSDTTATTAITNDHEPISALQYALESELQSRQKKNNGSAGEYAISLNM